MTAHTAAAAAFLAFVGAAALTRLAAAHRRRSYTVAQSMLYFPALLLTKILWRGEMPDRLPLPPGQGAVVISNHRSSIDPFFIQMSADRPVHWMVAREYCEMPLLAPLLRICEVIPVNRGGVDTAAAKAAVRLAEQGELVGMLPEGRINMTDEFLLPARPGAALVAMRAGVPILPCYIEGAPYRGAMFSPFAMSARVRVHYGQPLRLSRESSEASEEHAVAQFMTRCLTAIAELAGRSEYQPRLAGRRWKPSEQEMSSWILRAQRRGADRR